MSVSSQTGFLSTSAGRLEYVRYPARRATAPTLVFLHEGLGCVALWREVPRALAQRTGCEALVYSRAGYGRSNPVPLPRPVDFMHLEAAVLGEVLAAAGLREAILVGHSDGASIALIHAGSNSRVPIRGLVLEAPHVFTEPHGLA